MVLYSVLLRTPAAAPVISAVAKLGIGVFILIPRSLAVSVRRYGPKTRDSRENSFPPRSVCMTGHCARRLVTDKGAVTEVTAWVVPGPAAASRLITGQRGRRDYH
jgi:hypothetical protein